VQKLTQAIATHRSRGDAADAAVTATKTIVLTTVTGTLGRNTSHANSYSSFGDICFSVTFSEVWRDCGPVQFGVHRALGVISEWSVSLPTAFAAGIRMRSHCDASRSPVLGVYAIMESVTNHGAPFQQRFKCARARFRGLGTERSASTGSSYKKKKRQKSLLLIPEFCPGGPRLRPVRSCKPCDGIPT